MHSIGTAAAAAALAIASPAAGAEQPGIAKVFLPFGKGVTIPVAVDPTLVTSLTNHYVELYGHVGLWIVLVDTYDTNPAAGPHCAGGKERWVRVLDTAGKEEVYRRQVASCARGITVDDKVLEWDEDGTHFTILLTSAKPVRVHVEYGGEVKEVE